MRLPFIPYVIIVIIAILTVVSLSEPAKGQPTSACIALEDMEENILREGVKSITAKLVRKDGTTVFFVAEHDTGKWWLFRLYNGLTACAIDSGTGYVAGSMGIRS